MLPEIRRLAADNEFGLWNNLIEQYAHTFDEALIRYIGSFEEQRNELATSARNPVIWFREGIRLLIASPILILVWLGVFGTSTLYRLTHGLVFKLLATTASLLAFVSAVFSIVLVWDDMQKLIFRWLPWVRMDIELINTYASKWTVAGWFLGLAYYNWFASSASHLPIWLHAVLVVGGLFAAPILIGGGIALLMAGLTKVLTGRVEGSPHGFA